MVLANDQSIVTGWGETKGGSIPKYHNQFSRFRGYVFFDSAEAAALPWNTTKTGVDLDSSTFLAVRLQMLKLGRPVIDFLNLLDKEKDKQTSDPKPLESAVLICKPIELRKISMRPVFMYPKSIVQRPHPDEGRIQYFRPLSKIRRVQKQLHVSTLKDVGVKTFEYYYKLECQD
jgi:hypothetical protein